MSDLGDVGWAPVGENLETPGPCVMCDHDPAHGYASIEEEGRVRWLCHTDDHSCYEDAVRQAVGAMNQALRANAGLAT